MKGNMEERAERLAQYIIENRATVRTAAQKFGISKSTVHTDETIGKGWDQGASARLVPNILHRFYEGFTQALLPEGRKG